MRLTLCTPFFMAGMIAIGGCATEPTKASADSQPAKQTEVAAAPAAVSVASTPVAKTKPEASPYDKPGFHTTIKKVGDRDILWVFDTSQKSYQDYLKAGVPNKSITRIGRGPGGMSLRSPEADTLDAYLASKPGFFVTVGKLADRKVLWIFEEGSKHHEAYKKSGFPNKSVTRIGGGPGGMSLRSPEADTLDAYLASKPGFFVTVGKLADRKVLWIFEEGSKHHEAYKKSGFPNKSVTRIGGGPGGMSLRSPEADTLDAYLASKPGFFVTVGKLADRKVLWIFEEGSKAHQDYKKSGFPNKSVTRIGGGPGGMSIRSPEGSTIDAWLAMN